MLPLDRLTYVQQLMQRELKLCLDLYQNDTPPQLFEAISYALLSPGKRLRAYLVFETARLFNLVDHDVLAIALSIECMHCYSLIHDDLPCMDNSNLRRGQPTVHVKFDEATALLAGTALLVISVDLINKAPTLTCEQRCHILSMLIVNSGMQGMMGGQMLDIIGETETYDLNQIQRVQRMKTGCLIKFSVLAPILHNVDAQVYLPVLTDYADNLGLAYQIADDLADIDSTPDIMGKPINQDTIMNKSTFTSVLSVQNARDRLALLINKIETNLSIFGNKASSLLWVAQCLKNR